MNKLIIISLAGCVWAATCGWSQEINVTPTGVEVGAAGSSASGSLIQQSGQTTSFVTKDGVNPPEVRMVIKPDGKVGIGTTTPSEKFTVAGNSVTTGSATVGSLVVGTSPILGVGTFESAPMDIPAANATLTVAHGLGGIPKFTTISLRCITAEDGWAVGDEVLLGSVHMRTSNYGSTCAVNATSFKFKSLGPFNIHSFNSNSLVDITDGNWRLIFRAWR
jgi:hypothetical protein